MSRGFTASETIAAPPEQVWKRLTDWSQAMAWMKGIDSLAVDGDGAFGAGSTLVFQARGKEHRSTVVGWDPPSQLSLESVQGGVTAVYTYTVVAEGDGARLTLEAACHTTGWLWGLVGPLIAYAMEKTDAPQVAKLKALVEAHS